MNLINKKNQTKNKIKFSVYYKLALSILVGIALLSVAIVLFAYCQFQSKYYKIFEIFGQRKVMELESELRKPLLKNDDSQIKNILRATIIGSPFVSFVCVKSDKATICNNKEYLNFVSSHNIIPHIIKLHNIRNYVYTANVSGNKILVGVSLKDADLFFLDFLKKIIFLFLIGGFALVFASVLIFKLFIKPIKTLRLAIDNTSYGNYQMLKINKFNQDDEIGVLYQAFNNMNERLKRQEEQISAQKQSISDLIKKLIFMQEEEKKKIARDLHDQLSQSLVYIKLKLDIFKQKFDFASDVDNLDSIILDELKNIHDMCFNLRPNTIDTLGLAASIRNLVFNIQKQVNFQIHLDLSQFNATVNDTNISINIFRIIQEAIMNAIKYAKPKNLYVTLASNNQFIYGSVIDDGIGFDLNILNSKSKDSFGIAIIKERLSILNGSFNIESKYLSGTTINFEIPI